MRHRQWLVLVLFQWHFHRKLAVPCAVNPHHIIARIHTATQLERSSYFRYLPKNQRFFVVFLLLLFILAAKGKHSKMSSNTTKIYRHMYSHSRLFFMPSHFPISYSLYLSFSILYDRKSVWKRIVQDVVLTLILVYRLTKQKKIHTVENGQGTRVFYQLCEFVCFEWNLHEIIRFDNVRAMRFDRFWVLIPIYQHHSLFNGHILNCQCRIVCRLLRNAYDELWSRIAC